MIEVDEKKLLLLIEDALWCFDSYGIEYYFTNTMSYFYDMLQENILGLSDEQKQKVSDAIEKRLAEIKSDRNKND